VHNRGLLTEQAVWEHQLVALLTGLKGADRRFVGVKLAEILSGIGVSQADEVLATLEQEEHPHSGRDYRDEPVPW